LGDGTIAPGETTVVVLTGHGLKAAERIGDFLGIASD
jgi:threonine synthase